MEVSCGYVLSMETLIWLKLTSCKDTVSDSATGTGEDVGGTAEYLLGHMAMLNATFAALRSPI